MATKTYSWLSEANGSLPPARQLHLAPVTGLNIPAELRLMAAAAVVGSEGAYGGAATAPQPVERVVESLVTALADLGLGPTDEVDLPAARDAWIRAFGLGPGEPGRDALAAAVTGWANALRHTPSVRAGDPIRPRLTLPTSPFTPVRRWAVAQRVLEGMPLPEAARWLGIPAPPIDDACARSVAAYLAAHPDESLSEALTHTSVTPEQWTAWTYYLALLQAIRGWADVLEMERRATIPPPQPDVNDGSLLAELWNGTEGNVGIDIVVTSRILSLAGVLPLNGEGDVDRQRLRRRAGPIRDFRARHFSHAEIELSSSGPVVMAQVVRAKQQAAEIQMSIDVRRVLLGELSAADVRARHQSSTLVDVASNPDEDVAAVAEAAHRYLATGIAEAGTSDLGRATMLLKVSGAVSRFEAGQATASPLPTGVPPAMAQRFVEDLRGEVAGLLHELHVQQLLAGDLDPVDAMPAVMRDAVISTLRTCQEEYRRRRLDDRGWIEDRLRQSDAARMCAELGRVSAEELLAACAALETLQRGIQRLIRRDAARARPVLGVGTLEAAGKTLHGQVHADCFNFADGLRDRNVLREVAERVEKHLSQQEVVAAYRTADANFLIGTLGAAATTPLQIEGPRPDRTVGG